MNEELNKIKMASKNLINLIASIAALLLILMITLKYCNIGGKLYSDKYVNQLLEQHKQTKKSYEDSLQFVRGERDLQQEKVIATQGRVISLERKIDSLTVRHNANLKNIKPVTKGQVLQVTDTGFALAPNEFIQDCKDCFSLMAAYKSENTQLRFERDSYDTLMRIQNQLNEKRIRELESEKMAFNKLFNDCEIEKASASNGPTRKVKLSAAGMLNDLFLPRAGGLGLIYEDKKFNEYGGHVLFSSSGPIYLLNIAKTISLKRKK